MTQKNRSELKELFKTGAKPSQQDFADFIESTLNIKEDGIEKPSGADTPLKIMAQGTNEKLLDFYAGETKTWSINQKAGENKIGLNISNSGGSKLFIDSSNGNVGLSIDRPTAKLHIQQTGNEDALRIDDELKNTTPFLIDKDGNVGIGTPTPGAFHIDLPETNRKILPGVSIAGGTTGNASIELRNKETGTPFIDFSQSLTNDYDARIRLTEPGKLAIEGANVGIGIPNPGAKLEVNGNFKLQTGVAINKFSSDGTLAGNSDLTIPTEKAVKTYADTKASLAGSLTQDFQTRKLTVSESESLNFGSFRRQMINLWEQSHGIGIQDGTQYFRTDKNFAWYKGGSHNNAELNSGGGTVQMVIKDGNVGIGTSDPGGYKLTVEGNQQIKGTLTITNSLSVAASTGSTTNIDLSGHVQLKEYGTDETAYFQARDDSSNRNIGLRIRTQRKNDSQPIPRKPNPNPPPILVEAIVISPDGNVGIGTNPTRGKVQIEGSVNYQHPSGYRYFVNRDDSNKTTTGFNAPYSLYASHFIGCSEFNAFSDLRIKEIQGHSNSQADLETLLQIEVTDYYYKDKIANGNCPKKKVIGQQIAAVYPQAVSTHPDTVPDILQFAVIAENWITLNSHNLKIGEKIKILWDDDKSGLFTVDAITADRFKISLNHTGDVFVYGREVDDFHVVDYDALSMLHISATQELYKIIKNLEEDIEKIKCQQPNNRV